MFANKGIMNFYYYLMENFINLTTSRTFNITDPDAFLERSRENLRFVDENLAKNFFALIRVIIQQNSIFFNARMNAEILFYGIILLFFLIALFLLFLLFILPRSRATQRYLKVSINTLRLIPSHILENSPGFKTFLFKSLRDA